MKLKVTHDSDKKRMKIEKAIRETLLPFGIKTTEKLHKIIIILESKEVLWCVPESQMSEIMCILELYGEKEPDYIPLTKCEHCNEIHDSRVICPIQYRPEPK